MRIATLLYNVGNLSGAEDELVQCSALVSEFGSLRYEAQMTWLLGLVKYHQGEIEDAERLGLRTLELLERTGETYFRLQTLRTLALCAISRRDMQLAEERLREAIAVALEIGGWLAVDFNRLLVDVLIGRGRLGEARELGDIARHSVPAEDLYARAASLLIEASLATADGRRSVAEEAFASALLLLEEQRLPLDLGEARLAYGRALRQLGDAAAAAVELERAQTELAGMGARGLVGEIARELKEIEGAKQVGPLASP